MPASAGVPDAQTGPRALHVGSGPKRKVVLLDDDPDQLMLCKRALELEARGAVDVSTYSDPRLALHSIGADFPPAIVVVDVHLPPMGGPEVVRELRSRPGLRELTILMLSSSTAPADIDRSRRAGADAYLLKPGPALTWNEVALRVLGGWRHTSLLRHEHGR